MIIGTLRLKPVHSLISFCQCLLMFNTGRVVPVPDKIGTVKLIQAVTLLPKHEHLVWGRLPATVPMSPGSTVVVEPTSSRAMPRSVLVGRLVTPLWGDR